MVAWLVAVVLALPVALGVDNLLYNNGEHDPDTPTAPFAFVENWPGQTMGQFLEKHYVQILSIAPHLRKSMAFGATRTHVYDGTGAYLQLVNQARPGSRLYLVPQNRQFFWPSVQIGHQVTVPVDDGASIVTLETICLRPRVFYIHHMVADDDIASLVEMTDTKATRSLTHTGKNHLLVQANRDAADEEMTMDADRTSDSAWDTELPASKTVVQRSFEVLKMKQDDLLLDGVQLLKYKHKAFYNEHHDFIGPDHAIPENTLNPLKHGGSNRLATVFLYLSDVEEGGQTAFSEAEPLTDEQLEMVSPEVRPLLLSHKRRDEVDVGGLTGELYKGGGKEVNMAEKCYSKFSVHPRAGTALLFYDMTPDYVSDLHSKHAGCPVLKGNKYAANVWLWNGAVNNRRKERRLKATFINELDLHLDIFWRENKMHSLAPYHRSHHETFMGHTFSFRTTGGHVVFAHTMDDRDGYDQLIVVDASAVGGYILKQYNDTSFPKWLPDETRAHEDTWFKPLPVLKQIPVCKSVNVLSPATDSDLCHRP